MYVECIIISVGLNKYMIGFSFFCGFYAVKGIIFQTEEIINEMKGPTNFCTMNIESLIILKMHISHVQHAVHFFCSRISSPYKLDNAKRIGEGRMRREKKQKIKLMLQHRSWFFLLY